MPNRLANETSPYLLQHKDNPVDWYPWGEEALAKSCDDDKPIFLSIGYSACHWCHVMEHESFENEGIAAFLNEHFVSIKVDREERPDLDQIYMTAVQMLTGRGGWPMSVFLTPDLKPFYGGTYWPPHAMRGMPGFDQVLAGVLEAWRNRRAEVTEAADSITDAIRRGGGEARDELAPGTELSDAKLIDGAGRQIERLFDPTHGGFGPAPKFPHPFELQLLLRLWKRSHSIADGLRPIDDHTINDQPTDDQPTEPRQAWLGMVRTTLDKMAAGGMYDQLGGGFHRYSVDEHWLVPHFEKMLYDNALLANVYLEAWQATSEPRYERIVRETLDYLLRDMTDPMGGFYSAEDADSPPFEGAGTLGGANEEGLFYTWTPGELRAVLGEERAETFARVYDVTDAGNFEGRSILHLGRSVEQWAEVLGAETSELVEGLADARRELLEARAVRPRPGLDDKVLVNWNGLAIDAFARAGAALDEPRYLDAAIKAADFMLAEMRDGDGRLLHSWRSGRAKQQAFLDDYTSLANALVSLYEATLIRDPQPKYLVAAAELMDIVLHHFTAEQPGAYYYTANDHETLVTRPRDTMDNATPAGSSLAAMTLVRLGKLTGDAKWLDAAEATLQHAAPVMAEHPLAMGQMLIALDLWIGPTREFVITGDEDGAVAKRLHRQFLPRCVMASAEGSGELLESLTAGKVAIDGQATLYVCEEQTCGAPVVGLEAIRGGVG